MLEFWKLGSMEMFILRLAAAAVSVAVASAAAPVVVIFPDMTGTLFPNTRSFLSTALHNSHAPHAPHATFSLTATPIFSTPRRATPIFSTPRRPTPYPAPTSPPHYNPH